VFDLWSNGSWFESAERDGSGPKQYSSFSQKSEPGSVFLYQGGL
jgi:hypothetical protein